MVSVQVPEALTDHRQLGSDNITVIHYNEHYPIGRNLISFSKCAISFILSGQKELYRDTERVLVAEHEAVLIPNGNAIIAERKLNAEKYSSLVIFFSPELAQKFIATRVKKCGYQPDYAPAEKIAFLKFSQNPYITEYLNGMVKLVDKQWEMPQLLLQHKLEEIFLILIEYFPSQFYGLFDWKQANPNNRLRQIVENNILKNLSLTELAFLANRSLATFKRDFKKEYGISPGKYIRDRKLDIAKHELMDGADLNNIYQQLGYENASNFTFAFKRRFGDTPRAYQLQAGISS